MFQRSCALVPLARSCCGTVAVPLRMQSRNLGDLARIPDARSIIRDMNREMERIEQRLFRGFPFGFSMPRLVAVVEDTTPQKSYQISLDVDGFKPEDIKISFKDNVMKIEGQMEQTSGDGSNKLQQSFVRQFTLPENVDKKTLNSYLDSRGVLFVEADYVKEEAPRNIKIQVEDDSKSAK